MGDIEKIRVLIVDDIPDTRENIRKLLQFERDFEVVGAARTGKEGIDLTKETKPDVILMDINMPDMDGITATENIRRDFPHTQIIILSVQSDPNYMRRAMLAGARDFLTKPPSVDEMISAIRRAGKISQDERSKARPVYPGQAGMMGLGGMALPGLSQGKVIVVYSPKGGTGCTTIATNLAVSLHKEETPVIIVDGNVQFGDVAVFLNQQCKNSVADLAPRADELDPEIVEEVTISHAESGIKMMAAPTRPELADQVTGEQFGKVLDFLRQLYTYIVVDTTSVLSDVSLAAIDSADLIVLVTTQEIPAIKDARLFLDLLSSLTISRDRITLVLNRYDKRIGITPEKISENFKQEVVTVLPYDDRTVLPSVNRGKPFMLGDKSRPITRSFLTLTEAVRQSLGSKNGNDASEAVEVVRIGKR
jgi:pilus assembly protein CpaE